MMIRTTVVALLFANLLGGCSADIKDLNRCYAAGRAICKSLKISPEEGCINEFKKPCLDTSPDTNKLDKCIDDVRKVSGNDYSTCYGATSSSCDDLWSEILYNAISSSSGDNSCTYAYNGSCDEGTLCSYGTDTADCGGSSSSSGGDSCAYALNGTCDEGTRCAPGTDSTDCATSSSSSGSTFTSGCVTTPAGISATAIITACLNSPGLCGGSTTSTSAGPDSCQYALDGSCDEPRLCPVGTDTTDCSM